MRAGRPDLCVFCFLVGGWAGVIASLSTRPSQPSQPPHPQTPHRQALQPEFIAKVCPAVFGCVGYGAAMYELQPSPQKEDGTPASSLEKDGTPASSLEEAAGVSADAADASFAVRRLWARDDVSCGTSIPLIAEGAGGNSTTYCVGAFSCGVGPFVSIDGDGWADR